MFLGLTVLSFFTAAFGIIAGLGGGVMLLAVMATVFPPSALIPLHGAIQVGNNVSRCIILRRHIAWGLVPAFAVGAAFGAVIGGQIVVALPTSLLQSVLGAFVLYVCWAPKPESLQSYSGLKFFILGTVGTLVSMFVGATGVLLAPFIRAATANRLHYLASHSCLMILLHGLKLSAFVALGFSLHDYFPLLAAMITTSALGNYFGQKLSSKLSEKLFHRIFQVTLTILSLRLLYSGLSGMN